MDRAAQHQEAQKRQAARAALALLPESGTLGLGSGSTARLFIEEVGVLVRAGRDLRAIPTSEESRTLAIAAGIPLLDESGPWDLDVCVDGADEVSRALDLIKGGGGSHTREKLVNQAARLNIIIVDESKLSEHLGDRWPVPVEVLQFGHGSTAKELERYGTIQLRKRGGKPWLSDSGNYLFNVQAGVIRSPAVLDTALRRIPGVVETGLFVARADVVLVAARDGIRTLRRAGPSGPTEATSEPDPV